MDALRIAMDARCVQRHLDGVTRYVVNLVERLTRLPDVRLEIVALTSDEVHPRLAAAPGVTCRQVTRDPGFRWNERRLRFEQWTLPRILRRLDVDLYHATWNHGVPRFSRVPAVVTVHDLLPLTHPAETDPGSRLRRWAYRRSMRIAVRRARRIIAVSQAVADDIVRLMGVEPARIRVIHEAPDEAFRPAPPGETQAPSPPTLTLLRYLLRQGGREGLAEQPEPYLLYVGGAGARKNIGVLLAAAARARETLGVPVRLVFALDRDALSPAEIDAAARLGGAALLLGHVPDSDLPALVRGARAFVFPSRAEGFGLPPLEAMACGAPVIASNVPSIAEVVGQGGCLLDPDDVDGWARAMARAWTDEAWRADLAARGRDRAAAFSWSRTAEATLAVYREVLDG